MREEDRGAVADLADTAHNLGFSVHTRAATLIIQYGAYLIPRHLGHSRYRRKGLALPHPARRRR